MTILKPHVKPYIYWYLLSIILCRIAFMLSSWRRQSHELTEVRVDISVTLTVTNLNWIVFNFELTIRLIIVIIINVWHTKLLYKRYMTQKKCILYINMFIIHRYFFHIGLKNNSHLFSIRPLVLSPPFLNGVLYFKTTEIPALILYCIQVIHNNISNRSNLLLLYI